MAATSAPVRDPVPFRLAKRLSITPENAEALGRRVLGWARRYSADGYFPEDLDELAWCVEFDGPGAVLVAALVAEGVAEETERGPRLAAWSADVDRREKDRERQRRSRSSREPVTADVTVPVTPPVTGLSQAQGPVTPPVTPAVTAKIEGSSRAGAIPPPPPPASTADEIPDLDAWLHAILTDHGFTQKDALSRASKRQLIRLLLDRIMSADEIETLIVSADKNRSRQMNWMQPAIDRAVERSRRARAEESRGVVLQFEPRGVPG